MAQKPEKPDERRGTTPAFARQFPRDPALDALVTAFERGDYARVRAEAPGVERDSQDDAVKAAARTLVERTQPDPLAVRMLVVTGLLLVLLTGWWIVHGKAPASSTQTTTPVERVH